MLRLIQHHRFVVILASILLVTACQSEPGYHITVKNPLSVDRPDARITISRDMLAQQYPDLADQTFLIQDEDGKDVPFQRDDLDGDGSWDELALLYDLPDGGSERLLLKPADASRIPDFTDRANIWFAKLDSATKSYEQLTHEVRPEGYQRVMEPPYYYQYEGPGWENDRMGFRMYFDNRNAYDIWGKKTTDMVLKQINIKNDYHTMQSWGMDVLHVGSSLGAGGIAAMDGDSLYALGKTDEAEFVQVADGPVRAILDLVYRGWKVGNKSYDIRKRITIWGGENGYENEVTLLAPDTGTTLVAGIVTQKLPGKPDFADQSSDFPYVAGWGKQSEHDDNLGMAVVGQASGFEGYGQRSENPDGVSYSAFGEFDLAPNQPVDFNFVSGWEVGNQKFAQKDYFMEVVRNEGERLNNPVQVEVGK